MRLELRAEISSKIVVEVEGTKHEHGHNFTFGSGYLRRLFGRHWKAGQCVASHHDGKGDVK